jgi:membrane-bound metal-dependent hydrolase YbcI (DUF457 family)
MRGKVSFFGIYLGDFTPDFLSKFWVYGVTINGHHYGATNPARWHRGFPGMGITHTVFLGSLITLGIWLWKRNRAFAVGYMLGYAAHALTDINDSVGTVLLFPYSWTNFTVQTWSYAATVEGGKYLDAAAYYSSLGFVMDLFWLVVVLFSWRCLTRDYWRTEIVPPDARIWARLAQILPERGLLALYRATFFYGVCRMISWSMWAHVFSYPKGIPGVAGRGYPYDLSWTGPWWIAARSLPHVNPWLALPVALVLLAGIYGVLSKLWDPMGRAEAERRSRIMASAGAG